MRIIFAALALAALVAPAAAKPPADAPANSDAAVAPAPAPETTLTPLTPVEPVVTDNKTSASGSGNGASSGVFAWLARNGAADWRWLFGAMLALFVFLRLIRRGGGDRPRDLLGPPASMRPGAHPAVTPLPRTPDIR